MNYTTGTIVEEKDYTHAAVWCNENRMTLQEIKSEDNASSRLFEIIPLPKQDAEEKQTFVRAVRNTYLNETDKYMMPDYPINADLREKIKAYRQYLRDYTLQNGWQNNNPKSFEEWAE